MDQEGIIETRRMYDLTTCLHESRIPDMQERGVPADEMLTVLSRDREAVEEILAELQ